MSDLVDAYDSGQLSSYGGGNVGWWHDYIRAEVDRAHDFYAHKIERLTETNNALMVERAMLIKSKRDQIECLTAERDAARADRDSHQREAIRAMEGRDAALAKFAQYEQAPVVAWKLMHPLLHPRFSAHPITDGDRSLGWTDTALIARPEVTK